MPENAVISSRGPERDRQVDEVDTVLDAISGIRRATLAPGA